jgi:hypothetical protein
MPEGDEKKQLILREDHGFFWLWDSVEILERSRQLILGLRYIAFFTPAARASPK